VDLVIDAQSPHNDHAAAAGVFGRYVTAHSADFATSATGSSQARSPVEEETGLRRGYAYEIETEA